MGRPQEEGGEPVSRRDVMTAREAASHEGGVDRLQEFRACRGMGGAVQEHVRRAVYRRIASAIQLESAVSRYTAPFRVLQVALTSSERHSAARCGVLK